MNVLTIFRIFRICTRLVPGPVYTRPESLKTISFSVTPKQNIGVYTIVFISFSYRFSCLQFGTQVKFRWSRDHNNRTADNAFSAPWYYSKMELEPVAG